MTSNIGSQYVEGIDENGNITRGRRQYGHERSAGPLQAGVLKQVDEIIMFKPLTKDNIGGIIELLVEDVNKRLADRELSISLTDSARQFIVENGYDPVYGARPLKRYLQKHVETLAARLILADGVRAGDVIQIDLQDGEAYGFGAPCGVKEGF